MKYLELIENNIGLFKKLKINDKEDWVANYVEGENTKKRLAEDLSIISRHLCDNSRICECGAAPFILTKSLKDLQYEIIGVDIDPERFKNLDKININVKKADIEKEKQPFKDSYFDGVIFNELFEHCRINLIFTMKEIYRILKPGGVLILSTPNLKSIEGIINFLFRSRVYSCAYDLYWEWNKLNKFGHMGHIREYTRQEIEEFMENIGFETEKVYYRGKINITSWKKRLESLFVKIFKKYKPNMTFILRKKE